MLIEEIIEEGKYVKHYSDEGFQILQKETGFLYDEAVDVVPCRYTYEETDIPIDQPEDEDEEEANG